MRIKRIEMQKKREKGGCRGKSEYRKKEIWLRHGCREWVK